MKFTMSSWPSGISTLESGVKTLDDASNFSIGTFHQYLRPVLPSRHSKAIPLRKAPFRVSVPMKDVHLLPSLSKALYLLPDISTLTTVPNGGVVLFDFIVVYFLSLTLLYTNKNLYESSVFFIYFHFFWSWWINALLHPFTSFGIHGSGRAS